MLDVRRRAGAACLVTAPLGLLTAHLLQPSHGTTTAEEVAIQAERSGAFNASTVVGFAAMLLLVPAVVTLSGLIRDRWSGFVGGALAVAGALGLTFLLGTGVGATTIAEFCGDAAVRLKDELEGNPAFGVAVGVMIVGWTFGLITLAVGLWRARRIPVWAAVAIGIAPLVPAFAGSRVPVAIGFGLLWLGFAVAARDVVSQTEDAERELAPVGR